MEGNDSNLLFGFEMAVLGSTRRSTTVKYLAVNDLQRIFIPSLITVGMFDLIVKYFLVV